MPERDHFDAVGSLEMGEHVGEGNYPTYVEVLHRSVKPGGRVLVQQMSRPRGRWPGGGPFIESFIAPDMHMRPVGETVAYLESGGLEVRDVHALREHYVWTVQAWLDTFEANLPGFVDLVGEEVVAGLAALPGRRDAELPRRPDGGRPDALRATGCGPTP